VPPVARAAVAADVHQPLDVDRDVAAQVALDLDVVGDHLADPDDLLLGEVLDPGVGPDVGLFEDEVRLGPADPVDVRQPDLHPLVQRQIDSRDACHDLPLPLLVLGRHADDPHDSLAVHDFALGANLLDGRSNFHDRTPYLYR